MQKSMVHKMHVMQSDTMYMVHSGQDGSGRPEVVAMLIRNHPCYLLHAGSAKSWYE